MVRETISKLYEIYKKIDRFKNVTPGFGLFFKRYESRGKISFLFIVMEPPHSRSKGKLKDFEKVVNKSLTSNKLILPKDFRSLYNYLSSDFNKLVKPKDEILNKIKRITASLRLNFFEDINVKYSFISQMFPEVLVFDTITEKGQYVFYLNIVNLSEDGLILTHERQLNFLYEQIENGVNPITIMDEDLPDMRSGDTAFSFSREPEKQKSREKRGSVKKFREIVSKRRSKDDIDQELDYETVIDFNPSQKLEKKIKSVKKIVRRGLFGQPLPGFSETNTNDIPKPKPQPIKDPFPPLDSSSPSIEDQTIITKQSNLAEIDELEKKIEIMEQENVDLNEVKERNELLVNQIIQVTDELTTKLEKKDLELKEFKNKLEEKDNIKKDLENEIQKMEQEKNIAIDGIEDQVSDLLDEISSLSKSLEETELKRKELGLELEEIKNAKIRDKEKCNAIITTLKEEIQILNKKINLDGE